MGLSVVKAAFALPEIAPKIAHSQAVSAFPYKLR